MTRYGLRLGCRFGAPHDMTILKETPHAKWERCRICNKTFHYNKGFKGRINNTQYLKDHVRNFAQQGGATKRVFMKMYRPEECVITL